jgi:hypothetical protein
METHRLEREQRDATRKAAWDSAARNEGVNRTLQSMNGPGKKSTLADRAKYQFEADSEDDEMENEIDSNLGMLLPSYYSHYERVTHSIQMHFTAQLDASTNLVAPWAMKWIRRTSTLIGLRARRTRWMTRLP